MGTKERLSKSLNNDGSPAKVCESLVPVTGGVPKICFGVADVPSESFFYCARSSLTETSIVLQCRFFLLLIFSCLKCRPLWHSLRPHHSYTTCMHGYSSSTPPRTLSDRVCPHALGVHSALPAALALEAFEDRSLSRICRVSFLRSNGCSRGQSGQ